MLRGEDVHDGEAKEDNEIWRVFENNVGNVDLEQRAYTSKTARTSYSHIFRVDKNMRMDFYDKIFQ